MTVRWKPLLILSGLFLVIALVGVVAIVTTLVPKGAADILPMARAERKAKHFDKAKIYYQQALQKDGRNAATHEEFAAMYAEWAEQAPADQKDSLRLSYLGELIETAKYGKKLVKPRTLLLADAMRYELSSDMVHWAKELVELVPDNADAHYVLAIEGLEERVPNTTEARRHLTALEKASASQNAADKGDAKTAKLRADWIKARLAELGGHSSALETVLKENRETTLPDDASPVDRMALVRLRALDVTLALGVGQPTPTNLPADEIARRVETFQAETRRMVATPPLSPHRIVRLSLMLERVQKTLGMRAQAGDAPTRAAFAKLVDAVETDVESLFQKALEPANKPEISLFLTYADHLRYRQKRDQCLEAVARALKTPQATKPAYSDVVMALHAVAIESALAELKDKNRVEKAAPHIKELLASSNLRYQGLGHLFQGAIDLELSGVAAAAANESTANQDVPKVQPKLRTSALNHLKVAATQLPDVAEAQARYGVALVLSQEQGLGRQYLQNALRIGNLAAQYQIWAAWSMVQAGYPEEAQPIVTNLLTEIAAGRQSTEIEGTLHLLNAEIHQARRNPKDLKVALSEYERSVATGQRANAAIHLRLAQIEVQLNQPEKALARLDKLRSAGLGNPSVEHLAVLILQEQDRKDEARKALDAARAKFPKSEELVALDAALLAKEEKAKEADRILVDFLKDSPDSISVAVLRAQVLAKLLNKPAEARKILAAAADRSDNSSPLVQLALLDVEQRDFESAKKTIAKIRTRWKEAAAGDLLMAQIALEQGNLSEAAGRFDDALKKDPNNKLVQFWKAQIDGRTGSPSEARETLERIARDEPVKELDSGVTLMAAAESALASLELQSGDVDAAIQRFEELRKRNSKGELPRADRWQLAAAYNAKAQWANAKKELEALLSDTKRVPTDDERVRAANFYRQNNEDAAAVAQLDTVLSKNPTNPGAVVVRSFMFARERKGDRASALLRKAIEAGTAAKEPSPAVFYLMLAAVEDLIPPQSSAPQRVQAALDQGLEAQPDSLELAQAKYRLLAKNQGPKAAVAFAESKAKGDTSGHFKRFLVQVYSAERNYAGAEAVLRDLLAERPKDSMLAANMLQVVAMEAIAAAETNERDEEKALNNKAAALIREYRAKFPTDLAFLQADCDLAARRGDLTRAVAITEEMDKMAKNSPKGPLNRARIYTAQGRTREAAAAFDEALERNPRQHDVRVRLGQARLKLGEYDEAIRQAKVVLEANSNQPEAVLLEAQALAGQDGDDRQADARRTQAIELLTGLLAKQPRFTSGYHEVAHLQRERGRRADAIATLKNDLKEVPNDALGLTLLVEYLTERHVDGSTASAEELKEAGTLATDAESRDESGQLCLAVAIGYHKAGQLEKALPWAEKSVQKSDAAPAHLNYGDILLSLAEGTRDSAQAKTYFERAVAEYDLVLKTQANSVEATNNKAWILHAHLGQGKKALEIVQGLVSRVDAGILPPEVFDTLGAILEGQGKGHDAEEAYAKGLRKAPDHAVLNFHMGRLLAADKGRAGKAAPYLEKARAARGQLPPTMAEDLDKLVGKLGITQAH